MRKMIAVLMLLSLPALACGAVTSTESRYVTTTTGAPTVAYTFAFPAQRVSDVEVYVDQAKWISGFTLTLNTNQTTSPGGTVTFLEAPDAGLQLRIQRSIPLTQDSVWAPFSPFRAKTLEAALDRVVMQIQELARKVTDFTTITCPAGTVLTGMEAGVPVCVETSIRSSFTSGSWASFAAGHCSTAAITISETTELGAPCIVGMTTTMPTQFTYSCVGLAAHTVGLHVCNIGSTTATPPASVFNFRLFSP